MTISDRSQRLGIPGKAPIQKTSNLFHEPGIEHSLDAEVDSPVAIRPGRVDAYGRDPEPFERVPGLFFQVLAKRLSCLQTHFECTDDLVRVANRNAGRGLGIQTLEQTMKVFPAARFGKSFEAGAPVSGTGRPMEEPFGEGSEVEPRTARQNGNPATPPDFVERCPGLARIITGRKQVAGIANIDHVVGDMLPLGLRRFRTADIEPAEDLDGVVVHDLAVEVLGEG